MTSGMIDALRIGHLLHHVYLFENEQKVGRGEGGKKRPVILHVDQS